MAVDFLPQIQLILFKNPTALTNFGQMIAILLIPTVLCFAFGRVVGDSRQGITLIWAMAIIFTIAIAIVVYAEMQGNPQDAFWRQ